MIDDDKTGPEVKAMNDRLLRTLERRFGIKPTGFIVLALTGDEVRVACQVNHPEDAAELSEAMIEESENILRHYARAMAIAEGQTP